MAVLGYILLIKSDKVDDRSVNVKDGVKVAGDKLELHQIRCWCAGAEMRDLLIFSITAYMHATSLDTVQHQSGVY